MKGWFIERYKKHKDFLDDYGKVIILFSGIFVSFILISLIINFSKEQKLRVSFLDVGQGDAIFIQTPSGKQMLIDGGANNKILARLSEEMSYFDKNIDVIEATHPDADHVTGLIPVLEKFKVSTILETKGIGHTQVFDDLQKHIDDEDGETHIAQSGDEIDFHDGVIVKVLHPSANYVAKKDDTNDASISILVLYGEESFLLTGDLPSTSEPKLIAAGLSKSARGGSASGGNVTVYKAGHHGSKSSSGEQLLTYIRPEYAVISAGKDNKYGHPNPEALERLSKYSKEILSTIEKGTITFITDGKSVEVETEK